MVFVFNEANTKGDGIWFMILYTRETGPVSLVVVLGWCVIPFLLPDLIKIAMIRVRNRLLAEKLEAKLILQVHDELIVECPEHEREAVETLLRESMESAAQLRVPLVADVHAGRSWYDTK